jgi:hypothetical protein
MATPAKAACATPSPKNDIRRSVTNTPRNGRMSPSAAPAASALCINGRSNIISAPVLRSRMSVPIQSGLLPVKLP